MGSFSVNISKRRSCFFSIHVQSLLLIRPTGLRTFCLQEFGVFAKKSQGQPEGGRNNRLLLTGKSVPGAYDVPRSCDTQSLIDKGETKILVLRGLGGKSSRVMPSWSPRFCLCCFWRGGRAVWCVFTHTHLSELWMGLKEWRRNDHTHTMRSTWNGKDLVSPQLLQSWSAHRWLNEKLLTHLFRVNF